MTAFSARAGRRSTAPPVVSNRTTHSAPVRPSAQCRSLWRRKASGHNHGKPCPKRIASSPAERIWRHNLRTASGASCSARLGRAPPGAAGAGWSRSSMSGGAGRGRSKIVRAQRPGACVPRSGPRASAPSRRRPRRGTSNLSHPTWRSRPCTSCRCGSRRDRDRHSRWRNPPSSRAGWRQPEIGRAGRRSRWHRRRPGGFPRIPSPTTTAARTASAAATSSSPRGRSEA